MKTKEQRESLLRAEAERHKKEVAAINLKFSDDMDRHLKETDFSEDSKKDLKRIMREHREAREKEKNQHDFAMDNLSFQLFELASDYEGMVLR